MSEKEKRQSKKAVLNYFEESYQELRKVSWPTRNQAVRLTFLVLGFCLVAAVAVGAFDLLFMYGSQQLTYYASIVNPPTAEAIPNTPASTEETTATPVNATTTSGQPIKINATDSAGNPIEVTATPSTSGASETKPANSGTQS